MILAINTSTTQFGLALMDEQGRELGEYLISSGGKDYNGFMPALHSLLSIHRIEIADLKAIILAIGPGSFTGLRVGLSASKGIAHGLKIPIIGVSSLEAIANQMPCTDMPLCAMISSRKGEVFSALFKWDDKRNMQRLIEDTPLKLKDLATFIDLPTAFIGNDIGNQGGLIKELLGERALLAPPHLWNLKASSVGFLGLKRFLNEDSDNIRDLVPAYQRPPDIRPNTFSAFSGKIDYSIR